MDIDFREVCQNLYDGIHITDGEGREPQEYEVKIFWEEKSLK